MKYLTTTVPDPEDERLVKFCIIDTEAKTCKTVRCLKEHCDILKENFKMMKTYKFNNLEVYFEKTTYSSNNSLALVIYDVNDPTVMYAVLTVNLEFYSDSLSADEAYIDTNNLEYTMPNIIDWLEKNNIAKPTGQFGESGYCTYPAVKFNKEFLDETRELE